MTPVLVRVKNASSMCCRRSKRRTRRSPVTRFPTLDVSHVCQIPRPAAPKKMAIMMRTSSVSRPMRGAKTAPAASVGNRAWSKMRCTISGGTTVNADDASTRPAVSMRWRRYGMNSSPTRDHRRGMCGAAAFSARRASGSRLPPVRPRPLMPEPVAARRDPTGG